MNDRKLIKEPAIRLKFRDTLFIWLEKFRFLVMVNPKYLNSDTHSVSLPLNNKTGRLEVGLDVNIINLLLEAFGTNLFTSRYPAISEKRLLILVTKPAIVSEVIIKAASSANRIVFSSTASGKSLINKLKHNGPRILPWGTPLTTGNVVELWPSR